MTGDGSHLSAAQIAQLTALADGSLPERRRAAAQALVDGSPGLRELLEEQRRAIAHVHAFDVRAPAGLRTQLGDETRSRRGARPGVPLMLAAAIGTAVVVVAIAAVVLLGASP